MLLTATACDRPPAHERVHIRTDLRLAGNLDEARDAAQAALGKRPLAPGDEIALRLELAKIHDRVGLHTNTRPVPAALEEVERAAVLSAGKDAATRGAVEAAKAYYHYRAEMAAREFPHATAHAERAIALLRSAGDTRALADAVHLRGLIHVFRREFVRARALFDESLALDEQAGARAWMRGEYHRHVALIHALKDEWSEALPHYERSLEYRKEAGAVDPSLFAAISLATALIETGAAAAAQPHLEYALEIAEALPSPVGEARAAMVLGRMFEALGEDARARMAYERVLNAATRVALTTLIERSQAALLRLGSDENS